MISCDASWIILLYMETILSPSDRQTDILEVVVVELA